MLSKKGLLLAGSNTAYLSGLAIFSYIKIDPKWELTPINGAGETSSSHDKGTGTKKKRRTKVYMADISVSENPYRSPFGKPGYSTELKSYHSTVRHTKKVERMHGKSSSLRLAYL